MTPSKRAPLDYIIATLPLEELVCKDYLSLKESCGGIKDILVIILLAKRSLFLSIVKLLRLQLKFYSNTLCVTVGFRRNATGHSNYFLMFGYQPHHTVDIFLGARQHGQRGPGLRPLRF